MGEEFKQPNSKDLLTPQFLRARACIIALCLEPKEKNCCLWGSASNFQNSISFCLLRSYAAQFDFAVKRTNLSTSDKSFLPCILPSFGSPRRVSTMFLRYLTVLFCLLFDVQTEYLCPVRIISNNAHSSSSIENEDLLASDHDYGGLPEGGENLHPFPNNTGFISSEQTTRRNYKWYL